MRHYDCLYHLFDVFMDDLFNTLFILPPNKYYLLFFHIYFYEYFFCLIFFIVEDFYSITFVILSPLDSQNI